MERRAKRPAAKGRGSPANPAGRFERIEFVAEDDCPDAPPRSPDTVYYRDDAKRIISRNDSPDVPFGASMNPYRGCEHGCVYCYARPTHEYLGLSAGLDFETKIFVKENAAELLRAELASPGWTPEPVAVSGVTDCYQPAERRFGITRKCLEVFLEFRNPVGVVTKSGLVARDADVLSELAKVGCASVIVSITTLDGELARRMEPRASQPRRRLEAVEALASAGIAVTVLVAPVIPGLTDHEIPAILKEASPPRGRRRGLRHAQASPRGGRPFLRLARQELSARKEEGSRKDSIGSGREDQLRALRGAHEGLGSVRRADREDVPRFLRQAGLRGEKASRRLPVQKLPSRADSASVKDSRFLHAPDGGHSPGFDGPEP